MPNLNRQAPVAAISEPEGDTTTVGELGEVPAGGEAAVDETAVGMGSRQSEAPPSGSIKHISPDKVQIAAYILAGCGMAGCVGGLSVAQSPCGAGV